MQFWPAASLSRPLALATFIPSRVRARMRSASNSATMPRALNNSRPTGSVGSWREPPRFRRTAPGIRRNSGRRGLRGRHRGRRSPSHPFLVWPSSRGRIRRRRMRRRVRWSLRSTPWSSGRGAITRPFWQYVRGGGTPRLVCTEPNRGPHGYGELSQCE